MKCRESDQNEGASLSGHFPTGESDAFKERLQQVIGKESVRSFAGRANLSPTVVRHYVIGKSLPTLDSLIALTKTAKVNLLWLATGEGPQHPPEDGKQQENQAEGAKEGPVPAIDMTALQDALEIVEEAFDDSEVTMEPARRAELIAAIYAVAVKQGRLEKTPLLRLIKTMR